MSRFRRNEIAGATYHVMTRGVDRRRIFADDDFQLYTDLLAGAVERQGWHLLCHCLMPNHVHLVIETPDTNLANGMQWLHSRYVRAFNHRHGRKGHLFETTYKSPMITDEHRLARTVGYVVVNPVKAALCQSAAEWRWGSHAVRASARRQEWLSHARMLARIAGVTDATAYDDLIATFERLARARAEVVSVQQVIDALGQSDPRHEDER